MLSILIDAIRDWVLSHFVKKGNGEDTKAIIGRYNVLDYGIKNDGVTDNTTALQNLINSIPEGSVVFFPKGVYVITDEISIPRSMTFEGVPIFGNQISHGSLYFAKSQITLIGLKENISMFNVTANWAEFNVFNLAFIGNSYHTSFVNENTAWVSAPTHIIVEKERNSEDSDLMYIRDGINGITHLNGGGVAMRNCMFAGFSGYGTTIGTSQDIHDCVFYECKIGIKELEYDSKIRRCWFSRGETAIFCSWERERVKYNTEPVGDKDAKGNSKGIRYYLTLQVTDCWCDMMRGHFIHVESKTPNEAYHTVKLLVNDNWVDMLDSSAIYVDGTITQSSITGSFSRIGMMWANTNGNARTTANASECDIVNAYAIHNSNINVTTEMWNYANGQKRRIGHAQLHSTFKNLICPTNVASARNDNLITESDIVAYDAPLENITGNTYGMRNVRISCGKTDITRQRTLDFSELYILSPSKSMPEANKEWLGMTVLLTANSSVYVKGALYQCVASTAGGTTTYSWERIDNTVYAYSTMPTPSARNVGQSYLYTGETTPTYQKGGIYECQQTSSNTYEWKLINVPVAVVKDIVANSADYATFQSNIALL